jgi:hypothetical protein
MRNILSLSIVMAALIGGYARYGQAQSNGDLTPQQIRQIEQERHPMGSLSHAEEAARRTAQLPHEKFHPLTRKEKKAIEALKAPRAEDMAFYREFLKAKGTGIIRLFPALDCESQYVVRVDGPCGDVLPNASSLLFRKGGISSDLVFKDGELVADSFFAVSIMTNLGDVPVGDISLSTTGMKFLTDHIPATDIETARKHYAGFAKGITEAGRIYRNRSAAVPGTAYAVRIIAYRNGNNIRERRIWYLENTPFSKYLVPAAVRPLMDTDERVDLTVAFRVIRKDDNGSITLVWKELSRKEVPTLVFPDGVKMTDFKQSVKPEEQK